MAGELAHTTLKGRMMSDIPCNYFASSGCAPQMSISTVKESSLQFVSSFRPIQPVTQFSKWKLVLKNTSSIAPIATVWKIQTNFVINLMSAETDKAIPATNRHLTLSVESNMIQR